MIIMIIILIHDSDNSNKQYATKAPLGDIAATGAPVFSRELGGSLSSLWRELREGGISRVSLCKDFCFAKDVFVPPSICSLY